MEKTPSDYPITTIYKFLSKVNVDYRDQIVYNLASYLYPMKRAKSFPPQWRKSEMSYFSDLVGETHIITPPWGQEETLCGGGHQPIALCKIGIYLNHWVPESSWMSSPAEDTL